MLEKFRAAKAAEIRALEDLDSMKRLPPPIPGSRPSLALALRDRGPGAVIAEYKRASPSRGDLNLALGPGDAARLFQRAGAAALSVLTEKTFFKGSLAYLSAMSVARLPMLRKDFIFHPLQVRRTAATPASALLLVVRMFDRLQDLADLHKQAVDLGLECVVEVFDQRDLDMARQAKATLIQVNNRDLDTLAVDLDTSLRLAPAKASGETWIAASGLSRPRDVAAMAGAGFDGVLVGTSLMQSPDPEAALSALVRWRESA